MTSTNIIYDPKFLEISVAAEILISTNKCPDTRTLTKATELYRNVKV